MKKNSFNRTKNSKPHSRPQQKPHGKAQGFDGSQRGKVEKLQYPRSWRQVAGTHAIVELLRTRPQTVELALLQSNWRSSADLREIADLLQTKKIKIDLELPKPTKKSEDLMLLLKESLEKAKYHQAVN